MKRMTQISFKGEWIFLVHYATIDSINISKDMKVLRSMYNIDRYFWHSDLVDDFYWKNSRRRPTTHVHPIKSKWPAANISLVPFIGAHFSSKHMRRISVQARLVKKGLDKMLVRNILNLMAKFFLNNNLKHSCKVRWISKVLAGTLIQRYPNIPQCTSTLPHENQFSSSEISLSSFPSILWNRPVRSRVDIAFMFLLWAFITTSSASRDVG